jgi:hypothetical protein
VVVTPPLAARKLGADFPIFEQRMHEKARAPCERVPASGSVRKLDACLLECAYDRLAGASTHPSSWPSGAVRAEHADPYVAFVVAFKPNVDVPLARVGLEQVEHQQAWPFGHRSLLLPLPPPTGFSRPTLTQLPRPKQPVKAR